MKKYSVALKRTVVSEYLSSNISQADLARKYGIAERSQMHEWIRLVEVNGLDVLREHRRSAYYSQAFRYEVVRYFETHELSRREVAVHFGIAHTQVNKWVRDYQQHGEAGLLPPGEKGSLLNLRKKKRTAHSKQKQQVKTATQEKLKEVELQYQHKLLEAEKKQHKAEMERDILKVLATLRSK